MLVVLHIIANLQCEVGVETQHSRHLSIFSQRLLLFVHLMYFVNYRVDREESFHHCDMI